LAFAMSPIWKTTSMFFRSLISWIVVLSEADSKSLNSFEPST